MIKRIYAVWVYTNNLDESRRFYEEVLGLQFKFQNKAWVEFDLGGTSFAILERPKEKGQFKPQKTRIMFETHDIVDAKKMLKEKDVKLIGDIRNEEYGKLLTFEDPDGHWLEIFEQNYYSSMRELVSSVRLRHRRR